MPEPYYITTAIHYPNGRPHIGHAYETIAADVMARFQRLMGREVRFQTGTDEHGLKMAQKARERGQTPRELADEMSGHFRELFDRLNISYDRFIRTTDADHHRASQVIWRAMEASGDLYLDRYEGWYSVRDEAYYDESELIAEEGGDKLSPQGTPVEWTEEETWFFRLSKYQQPLLDLLRSPGFLEPESRRNEMVAFVSGGLRDLSVSRTSFDWGVKVPGAEGHVMYVWVDALTNYLTGLGYPDDTELYAKFWPANLHLIGKDIVRFHTVYWPAFLMSAGLPVPRHVFGHGFLLNRGQKESKSLGNVTDPGALADQFGIDALRYYLMDLTSFGNDGNFSSFDLVAENNATLAGTFGNLLQRVIAFISRKMNGRAPALSDDVEKIDTDLDIAVSKSFAHWMAALHNLELARATGACAGAAFACNKYVDDVKPWSELKVNPKRAEHTLASLIIAQVRLWQMLSPFVPSAAEAALETLQVPKHHWSTLDWDISGWYRENYQSITFEAPTPIFPTFELA